jgi:hypothetical protein
MDPFTMAAIASGVNVAGSIFGNASQRRAQERENKPYRQYQERKNALIDQF